MFGASLASAGSGAVQVSSRDLEDSVQMLLELAPTPSPPIVVCEPTLPSELNEG